MKLIVAVKRLVNHFFFANRRQSNTGINAKVKQDDTERDTAGCNKALQAAGWTSL